MCCILYAEQGFVFVDVDTDKTAVLNNDVFINVLQYGRKEVLNETDSFTNNDGKIYLDYD